MFVKDNQSAKLFFLYQHKINRQIERWSSVGTGLVSQVGHISLLQHIVRVHHRNIPHNTQVGQHRLLLHHWPHWSHNRPICHSAR